MWLKTDTNGLLNLSQARAIEIVRTGGQDVLATSFRDDAQFFDDQDSYAYVGVTLCTDALYPDLPRLLRGLELAIKHRLPYLDITLPESTDHSTSRESAQKEAV